MTQDTQWPTFEVFQQDAPGQPHQHVGAVHAPDAELALQFARDVFVRRPQCHSLWVVPTRMIFAQTTQALQAESLPAEAASPAGAEERYLVFQKQSQRTSDRFVTYVGTVEAATPAQALRRAQAIFGGQPAWVWWVCPAHAVTHSMDEDVESLFEPARDKRYRHPRQYQTAIPAR